MMNTVTSDCSLKKAAKNGDFDQVKKIFKNAATKEEIVVDADCVLAACKSGKHEVVELIMNYGMIDGLDKSDQRPLVLCCANGNLPDTKTLLSHGWTLDEACFAEAVFSDVALTVVLFMIEEQREQLKTWLLGDFIHVQQLFKKPLQQAYFQKNDGAVDLLQSFGLEIMSYLSESKVATILNQLATSSSSSQDYLCECLEKSATRSVMESIARLLIEHGFVISHNAACAAVKSNNKSLVELLLCRGGTTPFINEANQAKSAILLAAEANNFDLVKMILRYGAELDIHVAKVIIEQQKEDCCVLIQQFLAVSLNREIMTMSLLKVAISCGCVSAVQLLLCREVISFPSSILDGVDYLEECFKRHTNPAMQDIARLLVEHSYPISKHAAIASVHSNDENLVILLLSRKVAPFLSYSRRYNDKSAMWLAAYDNKYHLVETMLLYGAALDHSVAKLILEGKNREELIDRLLHLNRDMNETAVVLLKAAITTGNLSITKQLLSRGIQLPSAYFGELIWKAFDNHYDYMVRFLLQHVIPVSSCSFFQNAIYNHGKFIRKDAHDLKRIVVIAAEIGEEIDVNKLSTAGSNIVPMLSVFQELEMNSVTSVSHSKLLEAVLNEDQSLPLLFRQVLSCAHPLFIDYQPEVIAFYAIHVEQRLQRLLCKINKDDDVGNVIVKYMIDGPLYIKYTDIGAKIVYAYQIEDDEDEAHQK